MKRMLDVTVVLLTAAVWVPLLVLAMVGGQGGVGPPIFFCAGTGGKGRTDIPAGETAHHARGRRAGCRTADARGTLAARHEPG